MGNFLSVIIVHACLRMQHVRSYTAVYHLLQGKKSIQTLQDTKLFDLGSLYGIYKRLPMYEYKQVLRSLLERGLIGYGIHEKKNILVTTMGEKWLKQTNKTYILTRFHGIDYAGKDDDFYLRLMLLIQTLTNSLQGHMAFIPIADDEKTTSWVKSFYRRHADDRSAMLSDIHDDLLLALSGLSEQECAMFVDQLTSYIHYGLSTSQLAEKYNLNQLDVPILLTAVKHHMIHNILTEMHKYTILPTILTDSRHKKQQVMTKTADQTYTLYKAGCSVEEIARKRRLKVNTIYDHIVEITLCNPQFNIDPFVPKKMQDTIERVIKDNHEYKLKAIKDRVDREISYFQIRLVLCKRAGGVKGAPQ